MEGLLNIDKPAGLTSHDVVGRVRRLAGLKRVGHAGTLDPLATGVLLVALGRATRLIEYITGQPKTYRTTIRLGQTTDSYDAEGEIVAEAPVQVDEAAIRAALDPFRGPIQQLPPMYSAIKRDGQPLYKLARQGIEVERQPRAVTIYELTLLAWQPPFLELEVVCSAGTYIRSLAHDLGQALDCGGHVTVLRRTAVGGFLVEEAVTLETLAVAGVASHLQPAERAVAHLPRLVLPAAQIQMLWDGKLIPTEGDLAAGELWRLYDAEGAFAGLIRPVGEDWQAVKMFPPVRG